MKRLVICCDGTWQDLKTDYPTNVVKFVQAVKVRGDDDIVQVVFYDPGVGTAGLKDKWIGGGLGKGIDTNIRECYRFLILNYDPGDEVYLLGFSRGAYTVRSLAGLIYCSGLPRREHIRRIGEAYELYRDPDVKPGSDKAKEFRQAYGGNIDITLLACWDTVGALGVPSHWLFNRKINKKYRFHDTILNRKIRHALHAVSIDERRRAFNVTPMDRADDAGGQTLSQIWFAGTHGGVGGGSEANAGLSDIALQWMIDAVRGCGLGLAFETGCVHPPLCPDHTISFKSALSLVDRILYGRIVREVTGGFGDLHESVKRRWHDCPDYRPPNLADTFQAQLDAWGTN